MLWALQLVSCLVAGFGLIGFWIVLRVHLAPGLREPVDLAGNLFFLCMAILVLLHLEHQLSFIPMVLLYGLFIPVRVVLGVSQGQLVFAVTVGLLLVMTYATARRRIPWSFVIIGFAMFCIVQPVKGIFRKQVYIGGGINREQSETDKLEAPSSTVQQGMVVANTVGLQSAVSLATERLRAD